MKKRLCFVQGVVALLGWLAVQSPLAAQTRGEDNAWSVAILDQILAGVQPGQRLAQVGDMEILVTNLQVWRDQLAGVAPPGLAFGNGAPLWAGGNVYYTFTNTLTAAKQKAFLDGATEWTMFANIHFIPRTVQANYITVMEDPSLSGGNSSVGMVGGQQFIKIGTTSWTRRVVTHEVGHALGLVHEHQRSDRDTYVTINTNNITPGLEYAFTKLTTSQNQGAYDFLSIMHYFRNAFSVDPPNLDTIVPKAGYTQFLNLMGISDPVLSQSDRTYIAATYGAPAVAVTSVVTNTQDNGLGSLRAALYYGFDHSNTTVTFNIPTNDPGYSAGVFTIQPSDKMTGLFNGTVIDGSTEPVQLNPNGPAILLTGAAATGIGQSADGIRFGGSNCSVRSLIINGFDIYGVRMDGSNVTGNSVSGCYIGIDSSGTAAVPNGYYPVYIANGANGNTIGGTNVAARNIISGSIYRGVMITGPGTRANVVSGNYIGLNSSGTGALPNNWEGVFIYGGAQSNIIGGSSPGARNIISGNNAQGVAISQAGTSGNVIAGNYIGTDASGINAIANSWPGVQISSGAPNNIVGGTAPGAGNVISGNGDQGVLILDPGTDNNQVQGNFIGLNAAGTAAIANGLQGVEIFNGSQGNVVGGGSGARNFISGNLQAGVQIDGGAFSNAVSGNTIGLNVAQNTAVPNASFGVVIFNGAVGNLVGGTNAGTANLIAGNSSVGILISDANTSNNAVRANSMFGNVIGGLALNPGANLSRPAPTLSSAVVGTNTTIIGSLSGTAGTVFHLDFYSSAPPSSSAQGRDYLGTKDVTIGGGGSVTFTNIAAVVPVGQIIKATDTDLFGNTSGFSGGVTVTTTDNVGDGIPNAWRAANFGGPGTTTNGTSCATCDPDGDGLNNRQEFLSGTNPTNAASVLKLANVVMNGTNINVSFQSVTGVTYRVEREDDVLLGTWFTLGDQLLGTGGMMVLSDPGAANLPKRYYRLEVFP